MKASFKTHILFCIWNQRVRPRFIYTHRRSRTHIILIDARWEMYLTSSFLSGYKCRAHEAQSGSAAAMEHGAPGAGRTMALGHGGTWGRPHSGPRTWWDMVGHRGVVPMGAVSSGCLWTSGGGSSWDRFPSHVSRCFSCGWEEDVAHGTALEDAAQPHLQEGSVGELRGVLLTSHPSCLSPAPAALCLSYPWHRYQDRGTPLQASVSVSSWAPKWGQIMWVSPTV